nr:immunoglobulin heavy chain junction region [Mus musculus]
CARQNWDGFAYW